jgi:hypothetical protein
MSDILHSTTLIYKHLEVYISTQSRSSFKLTQFFIIKSRNGVNKRILHVIPMELANMTYLGSFSMMSR